MGDILQRIWNEMIRTVSAKNRERILFDNSAMFRGIPQVFDEHRLYPMYVRIPGPVVTDRNEFERNMVQRCKLVKLPEYVKRNFPKRSAVYYQYIHIAPESEISPKNRSEYDCADKRRRLTYVFSYGSFHYGEVV